MSDFLKKPKFPKARLIREDFLPEDDMMKNYRIKKVTTLYKGTEFYKFIPQEKVLFWWKNIGEMVPKYNSEECTYVYDYKGYSTLEDAQELLCNYIKYKNYPKEEYLDFNPEGECK